MLNTKIQEPVPFSQRSWRSLGCDPHHNKKSCQLKALGQLQPFHSRVTCFNVQFISSSCCSLQIWGTTLPSSPFRLKKWTVCTQWGGFQRRQVKRNKLSVEDHSMSPKEKHWLFHKKKVSLWMYTEEDG